MNTVDELRLRISNTCDMQSVVSTMKTLAAVNIRRYEAAADAMAAYNHTVEMGFHVLLRDRPRFVFPRASNETTREPNRKIAGAIIFGSDQGLCGQFNDQVVEHALQQMRLEATVTWRIIAVGSRVGSRLTEAEQTFETQFRLPTAVDDIVTLLHDLTPAIEAWQTEGVERIVVFHNSRTSAAAFASDHHQLLPLSQRYLDHCRSLTWPSNSLPAHTRPWNELFSVVVRQYLFAGLFRACAESRASENASRIGSMQAAEKNIDRRLAELQQDFRHMRQATITEELMDIITGFEALAAKD